MSTPIKSLKISNYTVDVYDDRVVLRKAASFFSGQATVKEIMFRSMTAVALREPGSFLPGWLTFSTGGIDTDNIPVLGGNAISYKSSERAEVEQLRSTIQSLLAQSRPSSTTPSATPASAADEIEKLAKLRDQGILTPAEFDAKKKSLLGL